MKSDRYRSSLIVSMLVAVWLPAAGAQAAIRYVALEGSGANGQSWATAYRTIQAAIDDPAMTDGGEVHVKKGTYLVTTAIDVDKAIKVFGGYSGEGETRAWEVYQTIIDGNGEASHGFRVTANAQIDGFAVIHGKGWGWMANGGGIAVAYCSATVSHCMIYGNRSTGWGGGLATTEAHGTKIANCTFQKNTCSYGGAGIYNENSNNVQITDCQFIENAADADGGGIHNLGSNATITGCTFQANRCAEAIMGYGGGIMNDQSAAIVTNCTFTGNRAPYGGGVYNNFNKAIIADCTFADCDPDCLGGGGVYNKGGSPTINRCLFQRNSVDTNGGGAIFCESANVRVTNCVMWKNTAKIWGGAVYINANPDAPVTEPQFINCTLYGNTATYGGAVCTTNTPSTFTNCILWGNQSYDPESASPAIYSFAGISTSKPTVRYCDVQGDSTYPGTGNIRLDPRFAYPSSGDFTLSFDSPCLDKGTNTAVVGIAEDYDGNPRVVDGDFNGSAVVDLGACELQGVPDHLTSGEIMRAVTYDGPSDLTATYVFTLSLKTDDAVSSVEFQAPGGSTVYTIPGDSHTSVGNVETYHRVDGRVHTWEYWAQAADASALAAYGDGTYLVRARYRDGSQAEMQVAYLLPGTATPVPQPTQKPRISSPAYDAAIGSPVSFTWDACTDGNVNSISLTIIDSDTDAAVASDMLDRTATSSAPHSLAEGPFKAECGFAGVYDVAGSDGTPFQLGKTLLIGHRFSVPYTTVYRFWSSAVGRHFYTIKESEKNKLINIYSHVWIFEGPAFNACSTKYITGLAPVWRFWSGQAHFYTIDPFEKTKLEQEYAHIWTYEGVAFYAFPEGQEPEGSKPVYRFWKRSDNTHFYTMDEDEMNKLLRQYSYTYTYEGVAFYAYP